jgi:hypothetical protein
MEQLRKTVKQWGINKAKRDVFSVSKIDSKLILKSAGKLYKDKFMLRTKKHKTPYFNISKHNKSKKDKINIDSDSSDSEQEKVLSLPKNNQKLPKLPKQKRYTPRPKLIDFSKNLEELNANSLDDNGNPHFSLKEDDDKLLTILPSQMWQSKMKLYYDEKLWSHMKEFKNDGKAKIDLIRKKYAKLLSPEIKMRTNPLVNIHAQSQKIMSPGNQSERIDYFATLQKDIGKRCILYLVLDSICSPMKPQPRSYFGVYDRSLEKQKYNQIKEINSLKDRLAKDGVSLDTKVLCKAILMPDEIFY